MDEGSVLADPPLMADSSSRRVFALELEPLLWKTELNAFFILLQKVLSSTFRNGVELSRVFLNELTRMAWLELSIL